MHRSGHNRESLSACRHSHDAIVAALRCDPLVERKLQVAVNPIWRHIHRRGVVQLVWVASSFQDLRPIPMEITGVETESTTVGLVNQEVICADVVFVTCVVVLQQELFDVEKRPYSIVFEDAFASRQANLECCGSI